MTDTPCPPAVLRAALGRHVPGRPTVGRDETGAIPLNAQLREIIRLSPRQMWVSYLSSALARIEELEASP